GRRDVAELLQATPGVVVTQAGGPGAPAHVSIRRSSAGEVLVLVDGVPLNSTITGDADLSRLSLDAVERVTVLPGSRSSRYGDRALGGVILVETRRAEREASATARTGAWGERDVAIAVGGTRDVGAADSSTRRISGSLTADRRTERGDFPYDVPAERGGGTARRENADSRVTDVVATSALDGDQGSLRARATWQESARGLVGSIVQPSLSGRETGDRATAAIDGRWTGERLTWTGTASLARERAAFADPTPPFGSAYDDDVDARSAVASGGVTAPLSTPVGAATAELGAEGRLYRVESTMLAAGAPTSQRQLGVWGALRAAHTAGRAFGAPVEWSADAGVRLDRNSLVAGTVASPRAGLALAAGRVSAGASISSSFASPTLADQFFHEGVLVRPNPDLRPERVRGELEAHAAVRDLPVGPARVDAEGSAYRANVDGMILWMPDYRFVWSPTNYDVHRAGGEGTLRATLPTLGVDAQATLAHADVTYAGPVLGGQVVYRPRTTASVAGGALVPRVAPAGTRVDVVARYVGERRTVPGYAVNPLAPYWRTDARLAVPLAMPNVMTGWAVDATAGVENLFDQRAAMLIDYPFPGRTWSIALRLRRGAVRP
ncbi:MAG TPA: TonB-dependent receptor plug domain-containing protein, partial [Gemmatirosa sp.]